MHRIAKFLRLGAWQRHLFLRALVLLPMTALGLRLLGLRRVRSMLSAAAPVDAAPEPSETDQVARLVMAAARHGAYRPTCLPLSLTLQRLLHDRGIHAEMRLGVRKVAGRLEAHAWLELDGRPLLEGAEASAEFAAFDEVIAPRTEGSR